MCCRFDYLTTGEFQEISVNNIILPGQAEWDSVVSVILQVGGVNSTYFGLEITVIHGPDGSSVLDCPQFVDESDIESFQCRTYAKEADIPICTSEQYFKLQFFNKVMRENVRTIRKLISFALCGLRAISCLFSFVLVCWFAIPIAFCSSLFLFCSWRRNSMWSRPKQRIYIWETEGHRARIISHSAYRALGRNLRKHNTSRSVQPSW